MGIKRVLQKIRSLQPGDLVCICWNDASIGSSFRSAGIPVLVRSWGVYVGSVGDPQHMILTQNDFAYNDQIRDDDYTAIPHPWATNVVVLEKKCVNPEDAETMLKNILQGAGHRRRRRLKQMRAENHERLD